MQISYATLFRASDSTLADMLEDTLARVVELDKHGMQHTFNWEIEFENLAIVIDEFENRALELPFIIPYRIP